MSARAVVAISRPMKPTRFFISAHLPEQLLRHKSNSEILFSRSTSKRSLSAKQPRFLLMQSARPAGERKHHQKIPVINAGSKFPIKQCHHRVGVELAMAR